MSRLRHKSPEFNFLTPGRFQQGESTMSIWEEIESFDRKIMEDKQKLRVLMKERNALYARLYYDNDPELSEKSK